MTGNHNILTLFQIDLQSSESSKMESDQNTNVSDDDSSIGVFGDSQKRANTKKNGKQQDLLNCVEDDGISTEIHKVGITENKQSPDSDNVGVSYANESSRLISNTEKVKEEMQDEEFYKEFEQVLDKITPQTFNSSMVFSCKLPINTEQRLIGVTYLIYEKALEDTDFPQQVHVYGNMCKIFSKKSVEVKNCPKHNRTFREILLERCQKDFESFVLEQLNAEIQLSEIQDYLDIEQKKVLHLAHAEKKRKFRMKRLGNVRFIGHLYKVQMLGTAIINRCMELLLNAPGDTSLECVCILLTIRGNFIFENGERASSLVPYLQRIYELVHHNEGLKISLRVKCMMQNILDLRKDKWVPRSKSTNLESINQTTKKTFFK